jgi:hypothetical protein
MHALQGLELLDVIVTDGDRVRSTAISVDPDCGWFERPVSLDGSPDDVEPAA